MPNFEKPIKKSKEKPEKKLFEWIRRKKTEREYSSQRIQRKIFEKAIKKFSKETINKAEIFSNKVVSLDEAVFPDNPIERILFFTKNKKSKRKKEFWCQYLPEDGTGKEAYSISLPLTEKSKKLKRVITFDEEFRERKYEDCPVASDEDVMTAVAGHEIRHRLQNRNSNLRFFSEDIEPEDEHLKRISEFIGHLMKYLPEKSYPTQRDRELEYDARFIEYYLMESLYSGEKDTEEIASIIKMEPPEK